MKARLSERSTEIRRHTATDGLAALACVRVNDYAPILLDLMMPRPNGYEFLESLDPVRGEGEPVIIVMTAFDTMSLRKLPGNRVHAVLHKPFDVERVVDLVRDSAAEREKREQNAESRTVPPPFAAPSDEESPVG